MADFTEEIDYLKLHEDAIDYNINRPLQELLDNTIYNKETWKAWRNDPILNNRLQLNASMVVDGKMTINDVLNGDSLDIQKNAKVDNLNVDSIDVEGDHILKESFPVGSVYVNASNSLNPADLLGFGTWEKFAKGKVLMGVGGGEYSEVGATGGQKEVTLEEKHLPSHTHDTETVDEAEDRHRHKYDIPSLPTDTGLGWGGERVIHRDAFGNNHTNPVQSSHTHDASLETVGENAPHNNMQPYITVYIWRRTS